MNTARQWDKKNNLVFAILLLGGLGLCLGGIWLPPLLVPGSVFLTGAFGMWGSAYTRMYPWKEDDEPSKDVARHIPEPTPIPNQTFIQNNLFFVFVRKFSNRSDSPPLVINPDESSSNRLTLS